MEILSIKVGGSLTTTLKSMDLDLNVRSKKGESK